MDELVQTGRSDDLQEMFLSLGFRAPTIIWAPTNRDLQPKIVARFGALCDAMVNDNGRIRAIDFDEDAIAHLSEWLILIDIASDGEDMRYSHYGEGIANLRGLSMVGQQVEDFGGHISIFFSTIYHAAAMRGERVFTIHDPPRAIFVRDWKRLIVPLFDERYERVERFAVANVPDNELSAGLEIVPDPVLIVDCDGMVRYANRIARELFEHQIYLGSNLDFFDFTGIDIKLPASPHELAKTGTIRDVVCVGVKDRMIEHFLLTVSGTRQFGQDFYVVSLRPDYSGSYT